LRSRPPAFTPHVPSVFPVLSLFQGTSVADHPSAEVRHLRRSRRVCRQFCRQAQSSDSTESERDPPLECRLGGRMAGYLLDAPI